MPKKGFKHTEKSKKKIGKANSIALKGYHPVNEFKKGNKIGFKKGNKLWENNPKFKENQFKNGKDHLNWKGGITPLVRRIRDCFKYRQWHSDIFTRDDFICQDCGKRGGYLEAHHLKEFTQIISENKIKNLEEALNCEELWNINNGQTLCKKCHDKTKKRN